MSRMFTAGLVALFALAAALPAAASGRIVDLSLVDRNRGEVLPEYPHRGRTYVPGEPGSRYAVRLSNRSGERVLVVLSVDGVNAISGENARPSQAGYVLGPWESAEITGWRKSMHDVAQFYFTDLPDSYAARTGRPGNVGVVGIAVFRERIAYRRPYPMPPPIAPYPEASADRAEAAREAGTGANATRAPQSLGTGHGEREASYSSRTTFERASSQPVEVVELRYEDWPTLAAMGVVPGHCRGWNCDLEPRAFGGFVPDPPRW